MRDLGTEGPVRGQLLLPHLTARKADTMTTIAPTISTDLTTTLRQTRDQLLAREAQRADTLARAMAEAESTCHYAIADDLRATINEDRAEDLDTLLDLLSPCPECDAEMGAACLSGCQTCAHDIQARLAMLDLG